MNFLVPDAETVTFIVLFAVTFASGTLILNFSPAFNVLTSLLLLFNIFVPVGALDNVTLYSVAFVNFALNSPEI